MHSFLRGPTHLYTPLHTSALRECEEKSGRMVERRKDRMRLGTHRPTKDRRVKLPGALTVGNWSHQEPGRHEPVELGRERSAVAGRV